MRRISLPGPVCLIAVGWLLVSPFALSAEAPLAYTAEPASDEVLILDTRPAEECARASLPGARCLPAADLLGPNRRLANISGILWLLGTVGLTGQEQVLVIGDSSEAKEFVAGVLYLAGQYRITLQTRPWAALSKAHPDTPPGHARSMIRRTVFQAPVRDQAIVLRRELVGLLKSDNALLLDGRTEAEYWGSAIRGQRGGHLPGAQHLPLRSSYGNAVRSQSVPETSVTGRVIAYAHDSYEGLVYLARLIDRGAEVSLYLEGWVGWASDGALPADSLAFPLRPLQPIERATQKTAPELPDGSWLLPVILASAVFALLGLAGGLLIRRMT